MATLSTILNRFSIKNFIADLPRILNDCMNSIYDCITKFYNEEKNEITCSKITTNRVDATTVVAQNLSLKSSTGESLSYENVIQKINELEQRIHTIEIREVTDEMIDNLN